MKTLPIPLPNGCFVTHPSVFPKNWKTVRASTKFHWRVQYYFKDPAFIERYPYGKLIIVKGMNIYHDPDQRRQVTEIILQDEMILLKGGYNPITEITIPPLPEVYCDIQPYTPFIAAMKLAEEKLKVSDKTHENIRCALRYVEKSADVLGFSKIPVQMIRRKNISLILNNCSKVKKHWSAQLFNHYRTYLMMCFKKCVELEAVENNPVNSDLPKEEEEINLRDLLTDEEIETIKEHFKDDKYFTRWMHIFFHSGARPIELIRLKETAVNLERMSYKVKVRKRKKIEEKWRPIKRIALAYWQEIMDEIKQSGQSDIYLFGTGLKPGKVACTRDYITKKWQREVKERLQIQKDMYGLKHKNLDETAAILDADAAARQAGHTSKVITLKHYLVNETERENNKLREVNNPL